MTATPRLTTIAAIATAAGRGGIGVVRLSGGHLLELAEKLSGKLPLPRAATFANFYAADGNAIDQGLLLYFPAPRSFTGEDVLELHGHGGPVVLHSLLSRCLDLGARLAEPGEFTRRAFLNGKLDLAQAEAVTDLIDAVSAGAARGAMRSLQGAFSKEIEALRGPLVELRMLTEATLDFPDEEFDFLTPDDALARLERLQQKLTTVSAQARQGQLLQNGLRIVLAGQPNVGKSSLLNQLTGDELAIVTPVAGTTRDIVRGHLEIEGLPLHVIDTAGLRETEDEVEKIGIARAWQEIECADVLLLLVDARLGVTEADRKILARLPEQRRRITVFNKIDLAASPAGRRDAAGEIEILLSAKRGDGIELLRQELLRLAGWQAPEEAFIARERHVRALSETGEHLAAAGDCLPRLELFAEELRLAQTALGRITGEFSSDDLLGEIFSSFCIGK